MTKDDYKIWEENVLNAIKDVSDIDMQRIAWSGLGNEPNIVSSYLEITSMLYDNLDFRDYIKYYESKHPDDELFRQMKQLDSMMSAYTPPSADSDAPILIDPKWRDITEQAKRTYDCRSEA